MTQAEGRRGGRTIRWTDWLTRPPGEDKPGAIWPSLGAVAFVLILVAAVRLTGLSVFRTVDEELSWNWANNFFIALLRGDYPATAENVYPGVTLMWIEAIQVWLKYGFLWLQGRAPDDITTLLGIGNPFSMHAEKRFGIALVNSFNVLFIYLWTVKLFGRRAGLLAAILIALDPFFLSDSRVIRVEALVTGFMLQSLLLFFIYQRNGRRGYLAGSGLMAGLSFLTKSSSLLLAGLVGPLLLLDALRRRVRLTSPLGDFALWGGVALAVTVALWPALWTSPPDALRLMIGYLFYRLSEGGSTVFFWGKLAHTRELSAQYYLAVFLFRSTPLLWLGLAGLAWGWRRLEETAAGEAGPVRADLLKLLAFVALYLVAISLAAEKKARYLIPIFPALDIAAGVGLHFLWGKARAALRPLSYRLWVGAVLLLQALIVLPCHPYYYTYWNPLLGGGAVASRVLEADLGIGQDAVARYLNERPDAASLTVAAGTTGGFFTIFKGKSVLLSDESWPQADFVLLDLRQMQRGKYSPGLLAYLRHLGLVYTAELNGLEYAWLYRGMQAQHHGRGDRLEGQGLLLGYDLGSGVAVAGESLPVKLYWQNLAQAGPGELYARLVDADGDGWARGIVRPLPDFVEAARTGGAIVESRAEIDVPLGTPPGLYYLKIGFRSGDTGQIVGEFRLPPGADKVEVRRSPLPVAVEEVKVEHRLALSPGRGIELLGYDLGEREAGGWNLTLYWHALAAPQADYVIVVRLLDAAGREAEYWLGRPVKSGHPTTAWEAGEVVKDLWPLPLGETLAPGAYTLEVEMIEASAGQSAGRFSLGTVEVGP